MSTAISNPPQTTESKSARKKKAKLEAQAALQSPAFHKERSDSVASIDVSGDGKGGSDAGGPAGESSYVREIMKQIRNVNKKLKLMEKTSQLVDANPGKSLDELVSLKIINADQKAQALKKPGLQSQLTALEDQASQYKTFEAEYQGLMAKERSQLKSAHSKEVDELRDIVEKEVRIQMEKEFKIRLLTFARFLKAAAERRQKESEEQSEEGRAFEGVLYGIYTGDAVAVGVAEKLIKGVEDNVSDYNGVVGVTYARVKQLSLEESPVPDEDPWTNASEPPSTVSSYPEHNHDHDTDPTITHAGLTELDTTTRIPNGTSSDTDPTSAIPPNANFGDAGNAAAEDQWDTKVPGEGMGMEESFEMVPRDPMETENREAHQPALAGSTQSWADETSAAAESAAAESPNVTGGAVNGDGFHEVVHHARGRGQRQHSGFRGRGNGNGAPRGGENKGPRPPRGDGTRGRGRGEGGFRGEGRGRGGRGGAPRRGEGS